MQKRRRFQVMVVVAVAALLILVLTLNSSRNSADITGRAIAEITPSTPVLEVNKDRPECEEVAHNLVPSYLIVDSQPQGYRVTMGFNDGFTMREHVVRAPRKGSKTWQDSNLHYTQDYFFPYRHRVVEGDIDYGAVSFTFNPAVLKRYPLDVDFSEQDNPITKANVPLNLRIWWEGLTPETLELIGQAGLPLVISEQPAGASEWTKVLEEQAVEESGSVEITHTFREGGVHFYSIPDMVGDYVLYEVIEYEINHCDWEN